MPNIREAAMEQHEADETRKSPSRGWSRYLGSPIAAGLIAAIVCSLGGHSARAQEPPRPPGMPPLESSITVIGIGTVSARPDTAEISAGVVTQGATAAQALAANSAAMEKVLKAAADIGVPERDIQTANVNVAPLRRQGRQEPQPQEITGYEATNQLRVKIRDLALLGRLLDALLAQGANVLGGISFAVADPAPLLDQARAKAMADARRKAEVYATAGNVALGRLLSVSESPTAGVPRFESPRLMAASAVPIAPGEHDLTVTITVRYAIR
jgi:uncharacterized protein YggE